MKPRLLTLFALLLLAGSALAGQMESALTADNTLWVVDGCGERQQLELTRRNGAEQETVLVPSTDDDAIESSPRLAWDSRTGDLFVVYRRSAADADQIVIARYKAGAEWAEPLVLNDVPSKNVSLHVLLTHAKHEGGEATLLHAAWWELGTEATPRYALAAFENGEHVSTDVSNLRELAGLTDPKSEYEDTGSPYPPLAIARNHKAVDAAFGAPNSTAITRVRIDSRRVVEPNARIWKPLPRDGSTLPPNRFVANAAPVESFIRNDRLVLYTPDSQFRYLVLDEGKWSPVRTIQLDEKMTSDRVLDELRRSIDDHAAAEEDGAVNQ